MKTAFYVTSAPRSTWFSFFLETVSYRKATSAVSSTTYTEARYVRVIAKQQ